MSAVASSLGLPTAHFTVCRNRLQATKNWTMRRHETTTLLTPSTGASILVLNLKLTAFEAMQTILTELTLKIKISTHPLVLYFYLTVIHKKR